MSNADNIKTSFTFPKAEHLKSRKAIEQLFKTGKTFFIRPYKVFYQMVGEGEGSQPSAADRQPQEHQVDAGLPIYDSSLPIEPLPIAHCPLSIALQAGFAVSTRNFKHAVDRNRVKRIGREAYRLNKGQLMDKVSEKKMQLQVFFVYTDKTLPKFGEAEEKMKSCLNKLMAIISK